MRQWGLPLRLSSKPQRSLIQRISDYMQRKLKSLGFSRNASGKTRRHSGGTINVLQSNGTTWQSVAPALGVTSIIAGTGLTGGTITSAGTIALDFYTGTTVNNSSYPIGSYISVRDDSSGWNVNSTFTIFSPPTAGSQDFKPASQGTGSSALTGTWRSRGKSGDVGCGGFFLFQRVA